MGLFFLALGVLTIFSLVLEGQVFQFFRSIVQNELATFLLGFFFFNISLKLFNSKYIFTKNKSLFGQFLIILGLAGFITSIFGADAKEVATSPGGFIGFYAYSFLRENLFFNFTPIVFMVILIFSIPFTIVMPIARFMDLMGLGFQRVINFIARVVFKKKPSTEAENRQIDVKAAATFGDFQKNQNRQMSFKDANEKEAIKQDEFRRKETESLTKTHVVLTEGSTDGVFINPELQYPDWKFPPLSLLNPYKKVKPSQEKINRNADIIEKTLSSFGIKSQVIDVIIGPAVTQYALDVALGVKVAKIANLIRDLALALATQESQVRLQFPIPGTSYVGIEIPNPERETVYVKEVMSDENLHNPKSILPMAFGKDIAGKYVFVDLQRMPHILIAGATGSGKSILINAIILSFLYTKNSRRSTLYNG